MPVSRRTLLKRAAGGIAAAATGAWALGPRSSGAASGPVETLEIRPGFHVLRAGGLNVLAVRSSDGLALVDGGSAEQSPALLEAAAALPGGPRIHTLFNTHWHPEQTGSNAALAAAGATIVAQRNTQLWLSTDVTWPWDGVTVGPLPAAARPSKSFYSEERLMLGERAVQLGHLRDCPHTDGDAYVYFPDGDVLAVGGAVTGAGWPDIDWWTGGWIGGIVGGLDMLMTVAGEATKIVPATGPVLAFADLEAQYAMYATIWERLLRTLYSGGGPQEALAAEPTREFDGTMGASEAFVLRAFQSLWAYLSPDA